MNSDGKSVNDDTFDQVESSSDREIARPDKSQHSRRDIVRHGVKLAFVAPVISTFFAKDAYAANYSCYATGHACDGARNEACCSASCNIGTDLCD